MLYLLDANVLITAHNQYYPINRIPEFWAWLRHMGETGVIKIPLEVFEEVLEGGKDEDKDLLLAWCKDDDNKSAVLFDEEANPDLVTQVITRGYADDLTDDELETIGRDPFLIAYALASPEDRCVVTTEISRPTKQRQNRKIPDVCGQLGVNCCNTFQLLQVLEFTTGWKPES